MTSLAARYTKIAFLCLLRLVKCERQKKDSDDKYLVNLKKLLAAAAAQAAIAIGTTCLCERNFTTDTQRVLLHLAEHSVDPL